MCPRHEWHCHKCIKGLVLYKSISNRNQLNAQQSRTCLIVQPWSPPSTCLTLMQHETAAFLLTLSRKIALSRPSCLLLFYWIKYHLLSVIRNFCLNIDKKLNLLFVCESLWDSCKQRSTGGDLPIQPIDLF